MLGQLVGASKSSGYKDDWWMQPRTYSPMPQVYTVRSEWTMDNCIPVRKKILNRKKNLKIMASALLGGALRWYFKEMALYAYSYKEYRPSTSQKAQSMWGEAAAEYD